MFPFRINVSETIHLIMLHKLSGMPLRSKCWFPGKKVKIYRLLRIFQFTTRIKPIRGAYLNRGYYVLLERSSPDKLFQIFLFCQPSFVFSKSQ